jgi:hypothetical protein
VLVLDLKRTKVEAHESDSTRAACIIGQSSEQWSKNVTRNDDDSASANSSGY